jgi:hypothetical protein
MPAKYSGSKSYSDLDVLGDGDVGDPLAATAPSFSACAIPSCAAAGISITRTSRVAPGLDKVCIDSCTGFLTSSAITGISTFSVHLFISVTYEPGNARAGKNCRFETGFVEKIAFHRIYVNYALYFSSFIDEGDGHPGHR